MTDHFDELASIRPTEARLGGEFPASRRNEMLSRITGPQLAPAPRNPATAPAPRTRPRWLVAGAAAATAGVLVAGSLLLRTPSSTIPPGSAVGSNGQSTAQGNGLTADAGAVDLLKPGQYQYIVTTSRQSGSARSSAAGTANSSTADSSSPSRGGAGEEKPTTGRTASGPADPTDSSTRESWIDPGGQIWARQRPGAESATEYYLFRPGGYLNSPTPTQLRTLPAVGPSLFGFLDGHVHGSSSREEAVFSAISDIFRSYLPTAGLRAGLVDAAGLNPSTTVERTADPRGRDAVAITFTDRTVGSACTDTIFLDASTLELIAEVSACGGNSYLATTDLPTVVGSLPADVAARAEADSAAPTDAPSTFPDVLGEWTSASPTPPTGASPSPADVSSTDGAEAKGSVTAATTG
jgi:hypothetical protein